VVQEVEVVAVCTEYIPQKTQLATAAVAAEVHIPLMVEVEVME
jgi:hypothetical protein